MSVISVRVNVQTFDAIGLQFVLGEHAFDGALNNGNFTDLFRIGFLDSALLATIRIVLLFLVFRTSQPRLLGVDDDDVVATIDVRCKSRLIFAGQSRRHETSQSPDRNACRINQNPFVCDFAGFL